MNNQKKIYLDHSATTPVDRAVLEKMLPYFTEKFGNPASIHTIGQEGIIAVDEAREKLAEFLDCKTSEIVFTSGATESNNLSIKGVIKACGLKKPHIITTAIEHLAVLETCQYLERNGVDVTYLKVNRDGIVDIKELEQSIKENTVLVSIMFANNEVGSIQPIKKAGKIIEKANQSRKNKIIFHTDAVQAIQYLDCRPEIYNVDLMSLSAHKFYGPKGVGALYVKAGTKIEKMQQGGHQEYNKRAGTLNVPGIVGLGEAISLIKKDQKKLYQHTLKLKKSLIDRVFSAIPNTYLNGSIEKSLPNIANIRFDKIEGESILLNLDFAGIAVSTGSACTSGTLQPSHVLIAMGISKDKAHGSIRFSFGKNNTDKDIDKVMKVLPNIIVKLRKMSPIK